MNVDEILADPMKAIELPQGAVPTHVYMIIEYMEPGGEQPTYRRLARIADDEMSAWLEEGMLRFFIGRPWPLAEEEDE